LLPRAATIQATVELLYHLSDHPRVLQSFIWQELDMRHTEHLVHLH